MSADKKKIEQPDVQDFRIVLSSPDKKGINQVTRELVEGSRAKDIPFKGPVGVPVKRLIVPTRKSPCGEGTNTWDKWEMRIHKRYIDCRTDMPSVKRLVTAVKLPLAVTLDVIILERK